MAILASMLRLLCIALTLLMVSACQPSSPVNTAPTVQAFPSLTPGRMIHGHLPTVSALMLDGGIGANPATAVALANLPTATPDYAACPALSASAQLSPLPTSPQEMAAEIVRYLSAGGDPLTLEDTLDQHWGLTSAQNSIRLNTNLKGDGNRDVLITYGNTLLILGCANGYYHSLYQYIGQGETPHLIYTDDMNADTRPDVFFASPSCANEESCTYTAQLITWEPSQGRFVNLISGTMTSPNLPEIADIDNDFILEIVLRQTNNGTADTGPLRTGVTIYDWNGSGYVQSITQLDPPRFRVQIVHQADRNLQRLEAHAAIELYNRAISDTSLRNWYQDDAAILGNYISFRLLTAHAFLESGSLLNTYQNIQSAHPDINTAPVYTVLSMIFWDTLQTTDNLNSACLAVHQAITERPEALDLINRYGQNSPTYSAVDLCPL